MRERLVLFAKTPRRGAVKTRLVPALGPEDALALYAAFLRDQIAFVASLGRAGREVEVCLDEPAALGGLPAGVARTAQGPGDLGARMLRAFARSSEAGSSATAIVGADAPTLPSARVEEAFGHLAAGADAVVVPAEDGGYVLLGCRAPLPPLFDRVPWGTDRVLEATRERAAGAGISLAELDPWHDVDVASDLAVLRRDLAAAPLRAPATAALLDRLDLPGSAVL